MRVVISIRVRERVEARQKTARIQRKKKVGEYGSTKKEEEGKEIKMNK
jgi:hypothetical protein